ncbi:MAG: alpha/beta hydrolase [Henriciella sp.]|uniref:alpha/beta fold hydrolase n=1 Tax=Henriciella sp. TaxID=1968823 RepID=UPI0032ED3D08
MKLFVHGIPDTPIVWSPLVEALGLSETAMCPALPGLATPAPMDFAGTPDAYVDWLIAEMEAAFERDGPIDLVGHDWGGLFVVRAACLRPDLIRSWTAANAVPDPNDPWPLIAHLWATPLLGEFLMAISPPSDLEKALVRQRMSEGLAAHEAVHWKRESRRAILKLYRSGMKVGASWDSDIDRIHPRGLVIWGGSDPYTSDETAETFCKRTGATLELLGNCGHWSIVECTDDVTGALKAHWSG